MAFVLNRKIKKAMKRTRSAFADSVPSIADHFFYGVVEINPRSLAMWYVFQTDEELTQARESGLCEGIAEATVRHLEQLRYPADPRGLVYFASWQEINQSTDGDPRLYFQ